MRTGRRPFLTILVIALIAACGDQAEPEAGSSTSTSPVDSTTITSPALAPTTTEPDRADTTGFTEQIRQIAVPLPEGGSDGASGSGCAPGTPILPDGTWFGVITAIRPGEIDFDLACWYMGEAAYEKALEADEEPLEFWIANDNPTIRTITVPDDATVWVIQGDVSEGLHGAVLFRSWDGTASTYTPCPGEACFFWICIQGETVTELVEQYIP